MKKSVFVLLAASFLMVGGRLALADDLLDAYRLAVQSDPQLKAAAASRQAVREAKPQARALLLPNLGFTGQISRDRVDPEDADPVSSTNQSYFLSLVQPIYRRDRLVQLRQADGRIAQAEAQYGAAAQDLVVRTSSAYFDVLSAQDNLEFARALKEAFARQLEQAKQRFEVGLSAITDVHEAQARYDSAVTQEIVADNQLSSAREALREITGKLHEQLAGLPEDIPLQTPEPADASAWATTAQEQNLQLLAAGFASQVAQEEIERRRSGHYPTLDLVGRYGLTDSSSTSFTATGIAPGERTTGSIGLQLSVPIYSGGLITSQTREARSLFDQAKAQQDQQRRAVLRQAEDAYRGVLNSISAVKAQRQAVISNQSALEATQAGYEVGTRTIVDVLNAEQLLIAARRDYATARYTYVLNTFRLKQAAGTLSEDDVKLVNSWLK